MGQPQLNTETSGSVSSVTQIGTLATSAFKISEAFNGIWKLTFDLPGEKVNKLSKDVMSQFEKVISHLESLAKTGRCQALVLCSGKPGNFIAGADIEMIRSVKNAEEAQKLSSTGHELLNRWEDLPFPTIAAIDGAALGGGCEIALGCTAIVMSNSSASRIGLPEVLLGIIPGMGGCVRLPKKIGLANALDLILNGKTLVAEKAYKIGLIEAVIPKEDFEGYALRWIHANLKALKSGKRLAKEPLLGGVGGPLGALFEHTPMGRSFMLKKAKQAVLSRTKGHYPAPLEAIEVFRDNSSSFGNKLGAKPRRGAMFREAQGFGKLAATDVSKNLIRIFFMTEAVKKSKGVTGTTAEALPISQAAVLGAGVMGGGIAQLLAAQDVSTRMKDITTQALTIGVTAAAQIFKKSVQKKKLSRRQYLQKLNKIVPVVDYTGFHTTDYVIEAIVENIEIKKKVFQELEKEISKDCIVVSNTSSLSVTEMQKVFQNPERFGGMHFFNPVSKMPLIEVIKGEKTSDLTVSTIYQFCKKLGKTPIVVKDAPGFLVNRLLMPYLNESTHLVAEGVSIAEIDKAMLDFGMPMGPIELIDEVGIDVGEKVAKILHHAFGDRFVPATMNHKMVEASRLGKKSGKGFYQYDAKGKKGALAPDVYSILGVNPSRGKLTAEQIVDRCLLPMINEAARCLDEKVVETADEVDLGMIMGTGFPPFRGGLLKYADSVGIDRIVEKLNHYAKTHGARYVPSEAILKRQKERRAFHS